MVYRVALVDDHVETTEELAAFCQRFAKEEQVDISSVQFNSAEVFLDYFKEFHKSDRAFDLIVFDIEMGEINGMEAARRIRQYDEQVSILFVTSLAQYAIQGYAVDALDFVVKPVDYTAFSFRLERALRIYKKQKQGTVALPYKKGTLQLAVQDILFIEVQGHQINYQTTTQTYTTSGALSTIEKLLPSQQFAKPNQSFLVNLAHVDAIDGQNVLVGTHAVSLSRLKKPEFLQAFSRYVGGIA